VKELSLNLISGKSRKTDGRYRCRYEGKFLLISKYFFLTSFGEMQIVLRNGLTEFFGKPMMSVFVKFSEVKIRDLFL
jgi:hypothetical protein